MGQELACRLHLGRRVLEGKAYLETDHVLFRGDEQVRIPLKDLKNVSAAAGVLKLDYADGVASFELGAAAEKWADKILHPPTRASKLGIKSGLVVQLSGEFPVDFLAELDGLERCLPRGKADLAFLLAPARKSLTKIGKLSDGLNPAGALWVVYPKGVTDIREIEVIEAGRAAGLKDVKVASFSPTHTALKFVIPVGARA
jgi:hypothetical protein